MSRLRVLILAGGLLVLVSGCAEEPEPPAPPPAPVATAVATKPAAAVAAPVDDADKSPRFAYDALDLRDPFKPFIKLEPAKQPVKPKAFVPQTPLQRYATEELKLVGIIWAQQGRSKALIEDPEGKGYVVRAGTLVGDRGGKIIRIEPERAVIEERFMDLFGEENVNVVTMKLHKPEGEVSR